MGSKIRYGIVGCGYMGTVHARAIQQIPGAVLNAVYSRGSTRAAKLAMELGCDICNCLHDLITREDIDAVIIATPNDSHYLPVIAAAENGKHVFCEKPLAISIQDCDEMLATCAKSGVILMIGYLMHFFDGLLRIDEWLKSDRLGQLIHVRLVRTGWNDTSQSMSWKAATKSSGGHLFHHIHDLDLLRWFVGPIIEVHSFGSKFLESANSLSDIDNVQIVNLRFANGAIGSMQYGMSFHWQEHYLKIDGTKGSIMVDFQHGKVYLKEGEYLSEFPIFEDPISQNSLIERYKKPAGGMSLGDSNSKPADYSIQAVMKELTYFSSLLLHHEFDDLNDSKSLLVDRLYIRDSILVASCVTKSRKQGHMVRVV